MKKSNHKVDVLKVVSEFQDEQNKSPRSGSFNIDVPFEQAVKKILKAKPDPKPKKKRSK